MKTLAAPLRRHRNNSFDILRLVAASLVIVFHAWPLTGRADPTHSTTEITIGALGLMIFFSISGYLIAASWLREPVLRTYAIKRGLRIMPALLVSAALVAFLLGPLVSSLSTGAYFSDPGTYAYVGKQAALNTFNTHLPGVFEANPYPNVVNGSLWTIPVEVCCYLAVAVAGPLGFMRRPRIMLIGLGVLFLAMVVDAPTISPQGRPGNGAGAILAVLLPCGAFLAGVLLWIYRERVPRHPALVAAAVASLVLASLPAGLQIALEMVAIPYATICIGSLAPGGIRRLIVAGDVSYGMYLFAYPTQQTIADLVPSIAPAGMIALALPISWTLGLLSWRIVENPALRLKARLIRSAIPPPDAKAAV
jgi:peptidoglycan/LPS O-acetylase OafA/YrhL